MSRRRGDVMHGRGVLWGGERVTMVWCICAGVMRMSVLPLVALLVLLCAARVEAKPSDHIILISVDGLRADHVGFYGYDRNTMPNLAKRVPTAVRFERAVTQASWTLPSFASLFTSRYTQDHGVYHMNHRLSSDEVLFTEVLQEAGYRTAGFVGGPFLEPQFGFARGFDVYRAGGSRSFIETAPQAAQWIRENIDKRFFVFLHGNDVHPPFNLPRSGESIRHVFDKTYRGSVDSMLLDYYFVKVYNRYAFGPSELQPDAGYQQQVEEIRLNARDVEHIVAHYDGQIFAVDEALEPVFKVLEEHGLEEDTIIIFTADHGLEMAEKDMFGTGYHATVWESINRVPLVIWHPDFHPRVVQEPVELVDVAPTLLDLIGVPVPERYKGRSLTGLMHGEKGEEEWLAFSASTVVSPENRIRLYSVQNERWKCIYDVANGHSALYDLASDRGEASDISAQHPDVALRMLHQLLKHMRTSD